MFYLTCMPALFTMLLHSNYAQGYEIVILILPVTSYRTPRNLLLLVTMYCYHNATHSYRVVMISEDSIRNNS